jgi:YidC/Oxa1 family membrane protein insertase
MRKNALNVVVFMFLAAGLYFVWEHADKNWLPKPEPAKKDPPPELVDELKKQAERQAEEDAKRKAEAQQKESVQAVGGGMAVAIGLPKPKPPEPPKVDSPKVEPPKKEPPKSARLIALGDHTFYNRVLLSTRGGGVQQVVLPWFYQADRLGREVTAKDDAGKPVGPLPLYLIPGVPQPRGQSLREEYKVPQIGPGKVDDLSALAEPSYTIFHYPHPDEPKQPDPMLGEEEWAVPADWAEKDEAGAPKAKVLPTGEHQMAFESRRLAGAPYYLVIRKTYTLGPKDYHVSLRVEIEKLKVPGAAKGAGQQFRYQLSGPRGLPVEGEWYTNLYRMAIVGWTDEKGAARRQYEDAAGVAIKRGGEVVTRGKNTFKYMAIATQYFASAVAIDDTAEGAAKNPWAHVRATTELPFGTNADPNVPYFHDVTVRAASEILDLEPGQTVAHSYVIYNGPAKVGLLKLMPGDREVDDGLVDRYKDRLGLYTITDFRSDNWLGRFASFIYWTDLVIACTNLMHLFLAFIHSVIPSWALSIIVLTVMVRLILFYPSKRQTQMSLRMMEVQKKLEPEFKKLQEKYKDDLHAYNREKTRLMMQNGANPFFMMGGCLLLFAQMPIMMGLYFCLQESVFFRLEGFLWINNLAAPDMLVWWGESIPYISTPEDIGSFLYLGPYFNLLPLLAVGLMLYQQAKMMPPSTDPQAEQQRMMMKMMMVMMAVFFYKVAAGLALYFIVSTSWGIVERQLIPRATDDKKPPEGGDGEGTTADATPKTGSPNGKPTTPADAVAAARQRSKGLLTRLREALQNKMKEMQKRADEQSKRQIRNEPSKPEPIRNPDRPDPAARNAERRDKKKKRKK